MIGLIAWTRSFTYDKDGKIVYGPNGPVFAAHPQPNLYDLIYFTAKDLAVWFDAIQLPPITNGSGEGYSPFCLRNFNSNWGAEYELKEAIAECGLEGMMISPDLAYRQMSGSNGGPGIYTYPDGIGNTTPGWFQSFDAFTQPIPPFVKQDSVPDSSGDFAFGDVRANENSDPPGVVEADTKSALALCLGFFDPRTTFPRVDDVKGLHAPSVLRWLEAFPKIQFYGEYFTGSVDELDWYVSQVMKFRIAVEDIPWYWCVQRACNGYDATQLLGGGFWQRYGGYYAVTFVNNPDVATSWSPTGGISEQIAFNLLLGYALTMFLPSRMSLAYAEDYFPANSNYPTGKGLKPFIDNMCWFAREFAYGGYEQRWVDRDVFAYTRDGDGGGIGQSGGCLIAVNFNTYVRRTITVQTMWPEGTKLHNFSYTGVDEDYWVGPGGLLTFDLKANYQSDGQSYYLIAKAGE